MAKKTDFQKIEKKWQATWHKEKIFEAKPSKRKKFYCLEMFPYPSGKLHMGHVRNYCIGDCIARFKRMQGFNVLYPMGFDAFGLPAENAAIERGIAPDKWTKKNIADMKEHLVALGFSYDCSRELKTCDPNYYALEQLFFLNFLQKGLAYRKKATVNYCPKCETVLANEQVHEGKCWRCDTIIKEKKLEQWFFKITKYADELLGCLDKLNWPERVKIMQQNWIGKSQGAEVIFKVKDKDDVIRIFTTRPDTLFGATFLAVSPEHELTEKLVKPEYKKQVDAFLNKVKSKTLREREEKGKEGIFTGSYAFNPANNKAIPIYIAEYVLEYGTGAIMCVPAHDQRDYEFAAKHNLPIIQVIKNNNISKKAYEGEGLLINSAQFNGMPSEKAKDEIVKWLAKRKLAVKKVNYKLKDWLISRQRYWGCPIPIVYCKKCGIVPAPKKDLPVLLPPPTKVKFGKGNPLTGCKEFVNTRCPRCNGKAKRETDTMDTFVDSSWYFIKYCSKEKGLKLNKEVDYWMPVDFYIGGIEHACMHLIYARFFTKVLADLGYVRIREPFLRLLCQGMVLKGGVAMSKSKGNVVSCDDMLAKYGADTIRLFELSSALPVSDLEWSDRGIAGSFRFLTKLYNLLAKAKTEKRIIFVEKYLLNEKEKFVQNVTNEIENLRFNIAISQIFIFCDKLSRYKKYITKEVIKKITNSVALLLCPFTPHLAEELWHLHNKSFAALAQWPKAKKLSKEIEEAGLAVENVMVDIEKIIKIVKKKPKKIYLYSIPK